MDKHTNTICAKCGREPSDMLILICNHNLCLICASKEMVSEYSGLKEKHVSSKQKVICEICSASTDLDPSSVIDLLKMCEEDFSESRFEREVQFQREDYSGAPDFCREHPDEPLSYYCFDCYSECICSECAIHGDHKSHDVMLIKKAYPIIKDKIEEIFLLVANKIDEVELKSEKIANQKKEIVDQGASAKQQVVVSFEDLKNRLEKKEREILSQIDRTVQEYLREAENFSRILNSKVAVLENISETLKSVLNEAERTELLDFYSENKEKILVNINNELSALPSIDKSTGLRYVVTPQSLAEHIDSIKSVQLQISSLKPAEDRPPDRSYRSGYKMSS